MPLKVVATVALLLESACATAFSPAVERGRSPSLDQPAPGQFFKFVVSSYKLDNVTWDAFAEYQVKVHDPRALPIIARHGVARWTQVY
jgi:hypothetical protein